jgi:NADH-quinone oxidoreductase subunit J
MDALVFYISGILSVAASLLVVTRRNPVYSAIFLVLFFVTISLDFLILRAPFLAVIQVLVYGGAIMVLFLFVLMLLNLTPAELEEKVSRARKAAAGIGATALFILLVAAIRYSSTVRNAPDLAGPIDPASPLAAAGETAAIADALFTEHVFPFELTSVLILVAIIGAIYLTGPSGSRAQAAQPAALIAEQRRQEHEYASSAAGGEGKP